MGYLDDQTLADLHPHIMREISKIEDRDGGDWVMGLIAQELQRAELKHPTWPTDQVHAAAVVAEEAGELVQAALQYHYDGKGADRVRDEAVQTAAMAIRLLLNLKHAERPGPEPIS